MWTTDTRDLACRSAGKILVTSSPKLQAQIHRHKSPQSNTVDLELKKIFGKAKLWKNIISFSGFCFIDLTLCSYFDIVTYKVRVDFLISNVDTVLIIWILFDNL